MRFRLMRYSVLLTMIAVVCPHAGYAAEREKVLDPNIVLMMADDMGMGDTSAYQDYTGNSDVDQVYTPQMDRLARMGVRFTDAHTPSSRCTPTRYALLTGRYAWRNRLKHWVLFGSQGDPMIEADRPTLATLMRGRGYRTAMVGKWHVGLRYRRSDGSPAAAWDDADLTQPLFDTPLDHGFDYCRITSRSHGTSGVEPGKNNRANQNRGPGHIHGRIAVGATGNGKKLVESGPEAYILNELGGRHSDHAIAFLADHLAGTSTRQKPFFLYYACNSNHSPYTPDTDIDGVAVAGAARNVAGEPMDTRSDFIYENDVALGRVLDYLKCTDDPRRPGKKLIDNTIVIFTSDNGAEKNDTTATGPFRSNKGSVYEGGHRVPFIVSWARAGVGDGDAATSGRTSDALIGLQDMYATFAEILGTDMPDPRKSEKGAEDSVSVLAAWRGNNLPTRPMIFNDHKEEKDHAAAAVRLDNPTVGGKTFEGKWKLFLDAALLREGQPNPLELYDLARDPREQVDRIDEARLEPLVEYMSRQAVLHRTAGGHRLAGFAPARRIVFDWRTGMDGALDESTYRVGLARRFEGESAAGVSVSRRLQDGSTVTMTVAGVRGDRTIEDDTFSVNDSGMGLTGGRFDQVDTGEALLVRFDRDVIIESAAIIAGNGTCGGFYIMGDHAPLAIYCVDGDNDAKDQSGILSDLGVLNAGQTLRLDSSPHFGVETSGIWRLGALTVRVLKPGRE